MQHLWHTEFSVQNLNFHVIRYAVLAFICVSSPALAIVNDDLRANRFITALWATRDSTLFLRSDSLALSAMSCHV